MNAREGSITSPSMLGVVGCPGILIHSFIASRIFSKPKESVSSVERKYRHYLRRMLLVPKFVRILGISQQDILKIETTVKLEDLLIGREEHFAPENAAARLAISMPENCPSWPRW
jgi:hypothetical protein